MRSAPILECRNLSISYNSREGEVVAVTDFNLELQAGEAHGLVGESGCGKSTVALAIMRYLGRAGRVKGGQILFQGRDLLAMGARELRRIRGAAIAMIYQEPMASLNPSMTVGEQLVEVPMYHDGVNRHDATSRARAMLSRVQLADVGRIMRSYPHQISGGQQQRIVIAMALLSNPRLLLLDEPTTALDATVEAGIVDLIRNISAEFGTSMLYISHNLGLVRETCDRITVMYSGEAVEVGPVGRVFRNMRHPYTQGLLAAIPTLAADKNRRPLAAIPGQLPPPRDRPAGCVFGPRCGSFVAGRCDSGKIAMREPRLREPRVGEPHMRESRLREPHLGEPRWGEPRLGDGRSDVSADLPVVHAARCLRIDEIDLDSQQPPDADSFASGPGDLLLAVTDLTKRYRHVVANEGLTFEVRRGETVAVVGESGCGKSTLARILMGLTEATSGSVRMASLELSRLPVSRRTRETVRSLQMIFQNPFDTLNPARTVGSQIARVIRKFGVERGESRIQQRVFELLDLVKLPRDFAKRLPEQLSGGQKQRVALARAFAGNPAMVVADEPLSALDVSVQAAVTNLLIDIQRQHGTTLLFISHDLALVRYLSDRVVVMYLGQIMEQGRADEVFAPPYHPYTEALLAALPVPDQRFAKRKVVLSGDIPSASNPPAGCRFCTRCSYRIAGTCDVLAPAVQEFAPNHRIACHLPRSQLLAMQPVFELGGPTAGSDAQRTS